MSAVMLQGHTTLESAARCYLFRNKFPIDRRPDKVRKRFGSHWTWDISQNQLDETKVCDCCVDLRDRLTKSKLDYWTHERRLLQHARTYKHIAVLYDVNVQDLQRTVKSLPVLDVLVPSENYRKLDDEETIRLHARRLLNTA